MKALLISGVVMFMVACPAVLGETVADVEALVSLTAAQVGQNTAAEADKAPGPQDQRPKESVSQYGITWTFGKPARVGQFVTGDFYVVGPVTVVSITPAPAGEGATFHNGSMVNPRMTDAGTMGYDGRDKAYYDPKLAARLPIALKPGDSLVSTIGYEGGQQSNPHVLTGHNHGETSAGWIRTAAVLTCLAEEAPADTFRPSYVGQPKKLYRFSDLHLDLLPSLEPTQSAPKLSFYARVFERPWLDHLYSWGSRTLHPTENMPDYGREIGRATGEASLLLMCNYPLEEKKKLLVGLVQYGIDLWGIVQTGGMGWPAQGGFGNGRKWPIVFAGLLFQDKAMQSPRAEFGEDQHTAFLECWTGAAVVFTGQYPNVARNDPERYADRGPYEHLHPSKWPGRNPTMSEGYRRTSSVSWIGQALAARLMKAEKVWGHDAFFAYADRWMYEDYTPFAKVLKEVHNVSYSRGADQGKCWEPFVNEMWAKYRKTLAAPTDGWRKSAGRNP